MHFFRLLPTYSIVHVCFCDSPFLGISAELFNYFTIVLIKRFIHKWVELLLSVSQSVAVIANSCTVIKVRVHKRQFR